MFHSLVICYGIVPVPAATSVKAAGSLLLPSWAASTLIINAVCILMLFHDSMDALKFTVSAGLILTARLRIVRINLMRL